jgi:hypothetical protein
MSLWVPEKDRVSVLVLVVQKWNCAVYNDINCGINVEKEERICVVWTKRLCVCNKLITSVFSGQ